MADLEEVDLTGGTAPEDGRLRSPEGPQGASPEDIRRALRSQPKPTAPREYDVEEADFWQTRYLPRGSVIEFINPYSKESSPPKVAVMILKTESDLNGIWVHVQLLGAATESEKKEAAKFFKSSEPQIHICYTTDGECPVAEDQGLHLKKFTWFPPGDFTAPYLTSYAKKQVGKGKKMSLEEDEALDKRAEEEKGGAGGKTSAVERRLSALRTRTKGTHRVTFADREELLPTQREDVFRDRGGAGNVGRAPPSSSRAVVPLKRVKEEALVVSDATDTETKGKKKKSKGKDLGQTLAQAAKMRTAKDEDKPRKRSRSRSRGRRRRRKKRHSSGSDSSDGSSRGEVSSEDSLVAPLKKRSQRTPGSVFQMLEMTAIEKLSADGIIEEGYEAAGLRSQRPKLLTYYQLCLKPNLDSRSRDCKELAVLSRSLDLLRSGRLAELADVLAARLLAVDTATKQGWNTARHLEVYAEEDEASVPPHVLLEAQRHARQVEKAGGKGSWIRQSPWSSGDWSYENRGKGKSKEGKGKNKKGKGKGKGGKNPWTPWNPDKEKPGEKGKKVEGET
eukprot:s1405_g8.t1